MTDKIKEQMTLKEQMLETIKKNTYADISGSDEGTNYCIVVEKSIQKAAEAVTAICAREKIQAQRDIVVHICLSSNPRRALELLAELEAKLKEK